MAKKKSSILMTQEQQQRIADQEAKVIQSYTNELAQVQARRCELAATLLQAEVTRVGPIDADPDACHALATRMMAIDSRQKWEGLRDLFAEKKFYSPQPALEWAASKVGVQLIGDEPDDNAGSVIQVVQ